MMRSKFLRKRSGGFMKDETGFTLIELLATIVLMGVLLAIGGTALRGYWFTQGLVGARNEVISQLRAQQEESRTTAPKVFGARFTLESSDWQLIRYDPEAAIPCSVVSTRQFGAAVEVESVDFDAGLPPADETQCLGGATDLVLFYARGSASPGEITLIHETIDKELSVCVTGLTGRVTTC